MCCNVHKQLYKACNFPLKNAEIFSEDKSQERGRLAQIGQDRKNKRTGRSTREKTEKRNQMRTLRSGHGGG